MSIERDLISKILLERDLVTVSDAGVNPNLFQEYDHREAYKFILDHKGQFGEVPSVDAFHARFDPQYRITEPSDALGYYCAMLIETWEDVTWEDALLEAVAAFDNGDTSQSRAAIAQANMLLNKEITTSRVTDITQTGPERLERYKNYATERGLLKGISSGFASIDYATGGFQPKQLITIVGPPKAGKTTVLLLSAMAAHRYHFSPLFIGFEMTNQEQEERHDAIRAKISQKALRDGRLRGEDIKKVERMMRRIEAMPPMIFSEDADSSLTLSGVIAQVEKSNPDIVFVDGMYMMEDEQGEKKGSPQALTNLTRGFKQAAKNLNLCFVISTQVLEWKMDRKRGITSNSIGYSSSFAQDSDLIIGAENTDEHDMKKLKVVMGRNAPAMETFVKWDWETGDFEEVDASEVEDEEDAEQKF